VSIAPLVSRYNHRAYKLPLDEQLEALEQLTGMLLADYREKEAERNPPPNRQPGPAVSPSGSSATTLPRARPRPRRVGDSMGVTMWASFACRANCLQSQ
jgi:hypothetical protein